MLGTLIGLHGLIGAGKTTYLKALGDWAREQGRLLEGDLSEMRALAPGDYFRLVAEPEEWSKRIEFHRGFIGEADVAPQSMIQLFYADPAGMALPFQVYAFATRAEALGDTVVAIRELVARCQPGVRIHIISERSLRSDKIFFKNLYKAGKVEDVAWRCYCRFWGVTQRLLGIDERVMLALQTNVDKSLSRVELRDRPGEKGIPRAYMEALEAEHTEMFVEFATEAGNTVRYIDFNADLSAEEMHQHAGRTMTALLLHLGATQLGSLIPEQRRGIGQDNKLSLKDHVLGVIPRSYPCTNTLVCQRLRQTGLLINKKQVNQTLYILRHEKLIDYVESGDFKYWSLVK